MDVGRIDAEVLHIGAEDFSIAFSLSRLLRHELKLGELLLHALREDSITLRRDSLRFNTTRLHVREHRDSLLEI